MQVSQVQDHVTHAVIGGDATIDFGISDSAEFFQILSSTLYKNQKLAMVRETLCNAWDAHVDANCREKAVKVTLDGTQFVIQDFGFGIPKDKIGPIYGVYGGSTKKHDGKQTGGFGLGCKAPFAYTDHFEVQSSCEGVRTIYNMSKSSAVAMGKPGIIPIASFPTTETGLTVTIHLKDQYDVGELESYIKQIVRNGEMNVELNGRRLDVIPFTSAVNDYLISENSFEDTRSRICVRYGSVIYPVESNDAYARDYSRICEVLGKLIGGYNRSTHIVFAAAPHTISVQPSREGLSMQEHTTDTLKKIFANFVSMLDTDFVQQQAAVLDTTVTEAVKKGRVGQLLSQDRSMPKDGTEPALGARHFITDMATMAHFYMHRHYPQNNAFHLNDILNRLTKLHATGYNRGLLASYMALVRKLKKTVAVNSLQGGYSKDSVPWFMRHVVSPIKRGFNAENQMTEDRLFTVGHCQQGFRVGERDSIVKVSELSIESDVIGYMGYLRNIVVLSYTRNDAHKKFSLQQDSFIQGRQLGGYFVYVVPRKSEKVKLAREYFEKLGVNLFDLTSVADVEELSVPRAPAVKRKRVDGLPVLSAGVDVANKSRTMLTNLREEDCKRVLKPEFFFRLNKAEKHDNDAQKYQLGSFSTEATQAIIKLFGAVGGLSINEKQETKLKAEGVKPIDDYLRDKVIARVTTNPQILEHMGANAARVLGTMGRYEAREIELAVTTIFEDVELCKELGIPNALSDDDKLYLLIWNEIESNFGQYQRNPNAEVTVARTLIADIPTNQTALDTFELIKNNPLIDLLDMQKVGSLLRSQSKDATAIGRAKKAREILLLALMS